jgi:hypothetical protein
MNFRGFASKIKASAAEAAAQLPTFDDMAAKDDYIHSEDFNVRGQKRPNDKESCTTTNSIATNNTTTRPATKPQSEDIEESSSVSSWSLLDRPAVRAALPTPSQKQPLVLPDSTPKRKTSQHDRIETTSSLSSRGETTSTSTIRRQNSLPLLAVVADTLVEPLSQSIVSGLDHQDQEQDSQSYDSETSDNGDNSDDDDYDEDDPIMTMIRKPSSSNKASKKNKTKQIKSKATSAKLPSDDGTSSKKSSRRFLDDLDDRLSTPESRMEAGGIQRVRQSETTSPPPPPVANQRWGWVKSMATEKMGQMLGRSVLAAQSRPAAPLARKKQPEVKTAAAPEEEDFHVASSGAVLADHELAQLANMKMKRSSMMDQLCMLLDSIKENRQFVFIAFTMLLAALVYFFTRNRSIEDDVT